MCNIYIQTLLYNVLLYTAKLFGGNAGIREKLISNPTVDVIKKTVGDEGFDGTLDACAQGVEGLDVIAGLVTGFIGSRKSTYRVDGTSINDVVSAWQDQTDSMKLLVSMLTLWDTVADESLSSTQRAAAAKDVKQGLVATCSSKQPFPAIGLAVLENWVEHGKLKECIAFCTSAST